jgi:phospholipase/carboxylesterase
MTATPPLHYVERPPKSSPSGPAPAIVLLHGRGADERDLLPITESLPEQLHIFSVRGPNELDDGYRWYDIDMKDGDIHSSQPDPRSFNACLSKVFSFLTYAVDQYEIGPHSIGILGFSQGAALALAATIRKSERVAWTVALNGYLPKQYASADKLAAAEGTPVFLAAGRMDLVIPQERVERAAARLRDGGLDVTYDTYPTGHGATDAEIVDVGEWVSAKMKT